MEVEQFVANNSDLDRLFENQAVQDFGSKPKRVRKHLDLPRHDPESRFVKGPIPMTWIKVASRCGGHGGRAEALTLLLWYAAGLQRSNPVKLTTTILDELQVHPKTARRLLEKFKEAGLVTVLRKRGACPLVTILPASKPSVTSHE